MRLSQPHGCCGRSGGRCRFFYPAAVLSRGAKTVFRSENRSISRRIRLPRTENASPLLARKMHLSSRVAPPAPSRPFPASLGVGRERVGTEPLQSYADRRARGTVREGSRWQPRSHESRLSKAQLLNRPSNRRASIGTRTRVRISRNCHVCAIFHVGAYTRANRVRVGGQVAIDRRDRAARGGRSKIRRPRVRRVASSSGAA